MNFKIREDEEFIKLGQLLKAVHMVSSGIEAKIVINEGQVKINGEVCMMRGKKVKKGDSVFFNGKEIKVI